MKENHELFIKQKRMRTFIAIKLSFDAVKRRNLSDEEKLAVRTLIPLFFKDIMEYDIYFPFYNDNKVPNTISILNFDKSATIYTTCSVVISKKHKLLYEVLKDNVLPDFEKILRYYFITERYRRLPINREVPLL